MAFTEMFETTRESLPWQGTRRVSLEKSIPQGKHQWFGIEHPYWFGTQDQSIATDAARIDHSVFLFYYSILPEPCDYYFHDTTDAIIPNI